MQNISCSHTIAQVRARSKTVTRRLGWAGLQPGTLLRVVEKAMGLKPGEKIVPLAVVRVVSVRRERLIDMTDEDCAREGFPQMDRLEFIRFFARAFKCDPRKTVTRIQWKYERRCLICGFKIHPDCRTCGECAHEIETP